MDLKDAESMVGDFAISITPLSRTVSQGQSATYTVTVQSANGFNGSVALSVFNLPGNQVLDGTGFSPQTVDVPSNGSASSTLTIATNNQTPTGVFSNILIQGVGGGLTRNSSNLSLTVQAAAQPNFTVSVAPASRTVAQGQSATYTVTVQSVNGFNGSVALSVFNLPGNQALEGTGFSPQTLDVPPNGSASSTLTIATNNQTPAGAFSNLSIQGVGGGLTRNSANFSLMVQAAAQPNFTISVAPTSRTVAQGQSATYTVTVQSVNGFNAPVALNVFNLPGDQVLDGTGFSPQMVNVPSNGSASSTLTIATNNQTPAGAFSKVSIQGVGGGLSRNSANFSLTVQAAAQPNFTVSVAPSSRTVAQGQSATYTVTVQSVNGFNGSVALNVFNLPGNQVLQGTGFSPQMVEVPPNGSASSTLTIATNNQTTTGVFSKVSIQGAGGGLSRNSSNFSLTVQAATQPGFTVSVAPTSRTVAQGQSATYTVTVQSVNGFNNSVALSVSNLPGDQALDGTGFSPQTVDVPPNGSASSTLTIATNNQTPAGAFSNLSIQGVGDGLTRNSSNFSLTVQAGAQPGFTVSVAPTSRTVSQGQSTTYTVTVQSANGFNGSVALSVSNLPGDQALDGTGFSPQMVEVPPNGSASSTLTIATNSQTPVGAFSKVSIQGVGGGLTRNSANFSLTVQAAAQPNFTVSVAPASRTVSQGQSATYTVTVQSVNGFNGSVALRVSNLPGNQVLDGTGFSPQMVEVPPNGSASSTLTIATNSQTPTGAFSNLSIQGVGGGLTRNSSNFSVTVQAGTQPDFTISVAPTSRTVTQRQSVTYTITVQSVRGFNGPVALSVFNLPGDQALQGTGFSPQTVDVPSNGSASSTLTIATNNQTPAGAFSNLSIQGVGDGLTRNSSNFSLTVQIAMQPDFTVSVAPSSRTVAQGQSATYTVTVQSVNGFNGSVALNVFNLPGNQVLEGTGFSLQTVDVPSDGSASSTLTIATNNQTPAGAFSDLLIQAMGGGLTRNSSNFSLAVQAGVQPGFTVSVAPASRTVAQGQSATYTVTVQSVNGFNGSVALNVFNLPGNQALEGTGFSPQTLDVPPNGSASSTLTIATNNQTPAGAFSDLLIQAMGGGLTRNSSNFRVTVQAGAEQNFTLSVNPSQLSTCLGSVATYTITVHSISDFNETVNLAAIGLPDNLTLPGTGFKPQAITPPPNGSVTSILTIFTNGATPAGDFTITIRAVSGNIIHETPVALTVNSCGPNYTLNASPDARISSKGADVIYTITVQSINGFSGAVDLFALDLPGGQMLPQTGFKPQTVTPPPNGSVISTFAVATNQTTPLGVFPLTIVGRSGGLSNKTTVQFIMTPGSLAPVASFTSAPRLPDEGQTIQFNDASSGEELTWEWDFDGNGTVDSMSKNPIHHFSSPGAYPVKLRVQNAYGADSVTQEVRIEADTQSKTPEVTRIRRSYPGAFIRNGVVDLSFDVYVDWKGAAPGRVGFSINGGAPIFEPGTTQGALHRFELNRDFPSGAIPSLVTITPISAEGQSGQLRQEYVQIYPFPAWLAALNASSLREMLGVGGIDYKLSFDFPPERFGTNSLFRYPSSYPIIGGQFGLGEASAKFEGTLSPTMGEGSFSGDGEIEFYAMNGRFGGSIKGSGKIQLASPSGLVLTSGAFNVVMNGSIVRGESLISAIPAISSLEEKPIIGAAIRPVLKSASLKTELGVSLDASFRFGQRGNGLEFDGGAGVGRLSMKSALRSKIFDRLTLDTWVSGSGELKLGVPAPYFKDLTWIGEAGARFSLDAYFQLNAEAKYQFRCGPDAKCLTENSADVDGAAEWQKGADLRLMQHEYARFGEYSHFGARPVLNSSTSKSSPDASETTLIRNVFPGASPVLIGVGSRQLLLWAHQNTALPVLQSTDIYWSFNEGQGYSQPIALTSDTRAELSPVAGVDSNGRVVAAWLRIKDPNFNAQIKTTDELSLFYSQLEVVSSVFDPGAKSWGPVTALTDDASLDTNLRLSADQSGRLMLSWFSNIHSEFTATATSPSLLKACFWNGTTWGALTNVASNLTGVSAHTAAIQGGKAVILLSRDPTPDSSEDAIIDLYQWNNGVWSGATTFARGGGENILPTAVFDAAGKSQIIWVRGEDLVQANTDNPTPRVIRPASSSTGFYDSKLLINRAGNLTLLWRQATDNGPANIFATIYDQTTQTWSADRRINDSPAMISDITGYYGDDGQLYLAYISQQINRFSSAVKIEGQNVIIPNIPQNGRADLCLLNHSLILDLAVTDSDLSFLPRAPKDGEAVTVNVDVHNMGDYTVDDLTVKWYAGEPNAGGFLLGSSNSTKPLLAGEHQVISFSFNYPSGGNNIIAIIDPDNHIAEFTKANNRAASYANNTAPQARIIASATNGQAPLQVSFDASTSIDQEGDSLIYRWAFADGVLSEAGAKVAHTFDKPGNYPVTLSVTDARGAVSSTIVSVTVTGKPVTSVSAASYVGHPIAAEAIIAAFGENLAMTIEKTAELPLPTSLANTSVQVTDSAGVVRLAPLFFISPGQINYQVPPGTAYGPATMTITNAEGSTALGTDFIGAIAPGLFTANSNGLGSPAAVLLRSKADGRQSYEPVVQYDASINQFAPIPIDLGAADEKVFLILFGTGVRRASDLNNNENSDKGVRILFDDIEITPTYVGEQKDFVGLDQINFEIPRSRKGKGNIRLFLKIGDAFSNTVNITLK